MTKEQINNLNKELKDKDAKYIITKVIEIFGDKIALSSSMSAEDQVLTDIIFKISNTTKIFTLDTGRLFPETYDLIDRTSKKYKKNIEVVFPDASCIEKMIAEKGINLFYDNVENRKLCCRFRKIVPLQRALKGLDAWICGLRASQSITRKDLELVEWDNVNGLIKINPLANWSEKDVWDYIKANNIPYNSLHDKGFPSIGCLPCTRAIEPGEDIRAGRWWWENPETKECGLHKK